jgi:hypothetical protein
LIRQLSTENRTGRNAKRQRDANDAGFSIIDRGAKKRRCISHPAGVLVYNMKRVMRILGVGGLMEAIHA